MVLYVKKKITLLEKRAIQEQLGDDLQKGMNEHVRPYFAKLLPLRAVIKDEPIMVGVTETSIEDYLIVFRKEQMNQIMTKIFSLRTKENMSTVSEIVELMFAPEV